MSKTNLLYTIGYIKKMPYLPMCVDIESKKQRYK